MNLVYTLAIVVGCDLLIALYNTMNKEKAMIQSGGEPLPTSSYVFLVLKYSLWVLNNLFILPLIFPEVLTVPTGQYALIVAVSFLGTYLLATLEEVLIRVLIVLYVQRSRIKQLKKQAKED